MRGACRLLALAVGFVLLGRAAGAQPGTTTVRGFVTEAASGQPLPGANVGLHALGEAAPLRGAVADRDGLYQIPEVPPGRYVLRATFVGYRAHADTLTLGGQPVVTVNVALEAGVEALGEVRVEAEGGAAQVEAGLQTIRPKDVARVPTPDVSGDLASYLQALPSVVAVGDRGGGLYVRGGTPPQNLVLMDGALVYQPFHIVGFFSAFPEDLVANTDFYAGGFGARYSGRISSVLDVTMREGNFERLEAAGSVSPFLLSLRAEGPLDRGEVSVIGSVRGSLIEQVGPVIGEDLPLRFGDAFVKVARAGGENSRCSLSGLYTFDEGEIDPDAPAERRDVFRWQNAALAGRCLVLPSQLPFAFEARAGLSHVRNAVGASLRPERDSDATLVNVEVHLAQVREGLRLGGGLFTRADFLGYETGGLFVGVQTDESLLLATGGYLDAVVEPGWGLEVNPGLAVTTYFGDYPVSLEPRLRLAWRPWGADGPTQLSAAAGLYRQTVNGISDERDAGSVFLAWLPNPVGGGQAEAAHATVGIQQRVGPFRLAVEGYAKELRDLAVPIWSRIAQFTTRLTAADGAVRGIDARLEWQHGPAYLFVGYGLARTEYELDEAVIVAGSGAEGGGPRFQTYPPPHDRRHQVNALFSLDLGGVEASVRWQYGSGLPFTQPYGFDTLVPLLPLPDVNAIYGVPRVLYRRPYDGRLPAYHRLDLSVGRTFLLGPGALSVQAGAINLYDRANLFYFDIFTVRRVDQLPLLPFAGVKFETR
ncbi:MAG: TonB-dependent receptor [Rhodothermales bacterium]|nr:TonB-dependent receptor [Rhodothermales bacterium]